MVDAGHWYSGKEILIPSDKVLRIAYEESKVYVSLTKEDIKHSRTTIWSGQPVKSTEHDLHIASIKSPAAFARPPFLVGQSLNLSLTSQ